MDFSSVCAGRTRVLLCALSWVEGTGPVSVPPIMTRGQTPPTSISSLPVSPDFPSYLSKAVSPEGHATLSMAQRVAQHRLESAKTREWKRKDVTSPPTGVAVPENMTPIALLMKQQSDDSRKQRRAEDTLSNRERKKREESAREKERLRTAAERAEKMREERQAMIDKLEAESKAAAEAMRAAARAREAELAAERERKAAELAAVEAAREAELAERAKDLVLADADGDGKLDFEEVGTASQTGDLSGP